MTSSRRDFLLTSATALGAAALGRPLLAHAWQQQAQAVPVFTPIRRDVGFFTMRGGTVGWLVNRSGVAVVDSQFPAEATVLIEGLKTRSNGKPVEFLINSHHHGDHAGGNPSFRGVAKHVVAHTQADQHMRRAPGAQPPAPQPGAPAPPEPLYPDTTFTHSWTGKVGDEQIVARHHGRAHTSGDIVVTFERANVVHMGDLMFNQRHPVVDRAAGASMRNWMRVLEHTVQGHARDTIYIFGHGNTGLPVTGNSADLLKFRDYVGAVLAFVESQVKAGKTREEVLAMRDPLAGFESFGRFGAASARDPLTVAYEEVTTGA